MSDTLEKVLFESSGSQLNFGINFQKATDATHRVVVGFATMDNLDQTGEKVTAEASAEAFRQFRGNIRTQHDEKNPVGITKAFEPATYFDANTGKTYNGIRIAVKVVDDAAWNKVLEGVYTGFSVGGAILSSHREMDPDTGQMIKVIDKYRLTEMSLVDNPGNELANFETIYKAFGQGDNDLNKSFAEKNLFWCPQHNIGAESNDKTYTCGQCGENMAKVGTVSENEDLVNKLTKVLSELDITTKGVITKMAEENEKVTESEAKVEETTTETTPEAKETETTEVKAEETTPVEIDYRAEFDAITSRIQDLETALSEKLETVSKILGGELAKVLNGHGELEKVLTDKSETIESLSKGLSDASEKIEKVITSSAMRQSEDAEDSKEKLEKSNSTDDGWDNLFTR